ncbi:MAG: MucR family transcriptional regulator [Pseudomonadota bacterium]|nr:MucR family transcriptional regulator [Pseudomonadota bacterium]
MERDGLSNPVELAAEIVSAYISNNSLPMSELANLITTVHGVVVGLSGAAPEEAPAEPLRPAVSIKKSISQDYLICLEDGRKFKSLKRHLRTRYNLTPEQYRAKWQLPVDYPMVAPGYAERRSRMAKDMGLGQQRRVSKKKK